MRHRVQKRNRLYMQRWVLSFAPILWSGLLLLACDPNAKVVRSKQEDPQGVQKKKEGDSAAGNPGVSALPSLSPAPIDPKNTVIDESPSGGKDPRSASGEPDSAGAVATGRCDTGDWGACFREARPFIVSDPKKAIGLYLKACLPGEKAGDGLACSAAAVLAKSSGNSAGAVQYFKAACEKEKYPVLAACREF